MGNGVAKAKTMRKKDKVIFTKKCRSFGTNEMSRTVKLNYFGSVLFSLKKKTEPKTEENVVLIVLGVVKIIKHQSFFCEKKIAKKVTN